MAEKRLSLPFLLVSTLLVLSLGTWVLSAGLARTIGKPEQTQALLNKSGIYQALIPSQVADAQEANPSLQNLPLDNPEIQKVLGKSLDSKKLQEQGNNAVDAIYAWLEGKSGKPQINIAVAVNQQQLAKAAGDYAAQFVSTLPACAPGQADYDTIASDPFSATCLPPGVDANMVRANVEGAVLSNQILPTQLTGDDVKLSDGKPVLDSFSSIPTWYQRAQKLPLVAAGVAILCILLLLLILGLRLGLKSAGKHLLSVSIVMALVAAGLTWLFDKFYSSFFPPTSNPNIGSALNQLSNLFDVAYRDNIIRLCAYMAIGGALLLVAALVLRLVQHQAVKPVPAAPSSPPAPANEPESLASAPAVASFTPSGPPSLPNTPAAAPAPAPASEPTGQKSAPKTTTRKPAAKKPSSARRKKK